MPLCRKGLKQIKNFTALVQEDRLRQKISFVSRAERILTRDSLLC